MTSAILSIGTELTRGELVNTNASWLADSLTSIGLEVTEIDCTDDDKNRIQTALQRLAKSHDLIVCTGGLGPTTDDITTECVAELLAVPLERDAASLATIRKRIERFGRAMAASNAKQADFPRGARILPNKNGTAPGFSVQIERALAFFLPGVPREMEAMFREFVAPEATSRVRERLHQVLLKTFGMTESGVNDRLAGIEAAHGVTVGYRAHFPEIEVKLLARAATAEEAEGRARAAAREVEERLGPDVVFAEGDRGFAEVLGELLVGAGLWLGIAESCTGGFVSKLLTERSGSSAFFKGAAITYSNELKEKLLGVSHELLSAQGAVSADVAVAMARGALATLEVDVALAVTGIAGPGGGTAEKPTGLVHYAVATTAGVSARQLVFPGSRAQVQKLAAFAGLALVRKVLLHGHDG